MILTDQDILHCIEKKWIICEPFDFRNVQPASLDLRLGSKLLIDNSLKPVLINKTNSYGEIKVEKTFDYEEIDLSQVDHFLSPGGFVLGSTLERVGSRSPQICSQLADKSTLARLGLSVFFSAGWIDPGNVLNITLELKNHSNRAIRLVAGMHICQLVFYMLEKPVGQTYKGKYLDDSSVQFAK